MIDQAEERVEVEAAGLGLPHSGPAPVRRRARLHVSDLLVRNVYYITADESLYLYIILARYKVRTAQALMSTTCW